MFGLNVLSGFVNNRQRLLDHLDQSKPRSILVMDDPWFATMLRQRLPQSTVIHRSYDPHEHEWHTTISPADWLTRFAPHIQGGNVLQCLNEPQGYGDLKPLVDWCVEVMTLAAPQGIRLCLPNFGVGHPKEDFAPELDDLLRAFHRFPQHILGLHEYAQFSTLTERPYRIGRFASILKRADVLGLRRPQIIITEHGRDVGGGINDGWKGLGLSEEAYYQFIVDCADIYGEYNVTTCTFCYGKGGGDMWRSFDVQDAPIFLDKLANWNRTHAMADYGQRIAQATVVLVGASAVNIRSTPSTSLPAVGQLLGGEVIPYYNTPQNGWWQIEWNGQLRYTSSTYVQFTVSDAQEQWIGQMRALIDGMYDLLNNPPA